MKRSDMIDIIIQHLLLGSIFDHETDSIAEELLKGIETEGMAPPFRDTIQKNNGRDIAIPSRTWEPENV